MRDNLEFFVIIGAVMLFLVCMLFGISYTAKLSNECRLAAIAKGMNAADVQVACR